VGTGSARYGTGSFTYQLPIHEGGANGNKNFTPPRPSRNEVNRTATVLGVVLLVVAAGAGANAADLGPLSDLTADLPDVPVDGTAPAPSPVDGGDDGSAAGDAREEAGTDGSDGSSSDSSGDGSSGSAESGSGSGGDSSGSAESGSGSDADGTSGEASDAESEPSGKPFAIQVVSIEKCGKTCRDVTLRVTNRRDRAQTGVAVDARIFAGKGTDGERIWKDSADVGRLGAGESTTLTRRVKLGFGAALAVNDADGWVTVRTEVTAADASATFTERKNVM